jgi:hypothetical protein
MPSKKRGKLTFKGKIDPRLIPTDSAPGFEIIDAKITESAVEVWLSDGRIIITPLSWYPTLEAATPKQRRGFENLRVGLAWEESARSAGWSDIYRPDRGLETPLGSYRKLLGNGWHENQQCSNQRRENGS